MADTFTKNYALTKTQYNSRQWHDKVNDNFDTIDAIMGSFAAISGLKGTWKNSTEYATDDITVDPDLGTLWKAVSPHTSTATGTFLEARLANPSLWVPYAQAASFRGEWQPSTNYNFNDFIVKSGVGKGRFAICLTTHTSGTDFDADLALGRWAILVDGSLYILPNLAGAPDANKVVVADATGTIYTLISRLALYNSFGLPPASDISEVVNNVTSRFEVPVRITNGNIAINAPPAGTLLHLSQNTDIECNFLLDGYGNSAASTPRIKLRKARGTPAAPTAVQSGDFLGAIDFAGRGSTSYSGSTAILAAQATENWTDIARGYGGTLFGGPNGTTSAQIAMQWMGGEVTALNLPAWTTWSPTITAGGGAFGSMTIHAAKYLKLGRLVFLHFVIQITAIGTATNALISNLPFAIVTNAINADCMYGCNNSQATAAVVTIETGVPRIVFRKYDGTFGINTSDTITIKGYYESQS